MDMDLPEKSLTDINAYCTLLFQLDPTESDVKKARVILGQYISEAVQIGVKLPNDDFWVQPRSAKEWDDLLEGYGPEFCTKIIQEYTTNSFANMQDLLRLRNKSSPPPVPIPFVETIQKAWKAPFIGDTNLLQAHILSALERTASIYSLSFPIIQSSGCGKSRLVDQLAQVWYTFPFCLGEADGPLNYSYPPPDPVVRQFFNRGGGVNVWHRALCFMASLFQHAATESSKFTSAMALYEYFDPTTNAQQRSEFYTKVVDLARGMERRTRPTRKLVLEMCEAARSLCTKLGIGMQPLILYFDEAHTLKDGLKEITRIFADLQSCGLRIVGIYLSTNADMGTLAPSSAQTMSNRLPGKDLIRPFSELRLDLFSSDNPILRGHPSNLTLDNIRSISSAACIGRPMWQAHIHGGYPTADLVGLALQKLLHNKSLATDSLSESAKYALLAYRLMIQCDPASRMLVHKLISSHLGFAYYASRDRTELITGYPPEPMVSAAAANYMVQLLDNHSSTSRMEVSWIKWLKTILATQWISRGNRGELITRAILTLARDLAYKDLYGCDPTVDLSVRSILPGHKPIPLAKFFEKLIGVHGWTTLKDTTLPVNHTKDAARPLGEYISKAMIDFTTFTQAGDESVFTYSGMISALLQGAAVVCRPSQPEYDHIIVFVIDSTQPLRLGNIGLICIQDTNSIALVDPILQPFELLPLDPKQGKNAPLVPIISLVMRHGHAIPPFAKQSPERGSHSNSDPPHYHILFSSSPHLIDDFTYRELLNADPAVQRYESLICHHFDSSSRQHQYEQDFVNQLYLNRYYGVTAKAKPLFMRHLQFD